MDSPDLIPEGFGRVQGTPGNPWGPLKHAETLEFLGFWDFWKIPETLENPEIQGNLVFQGSPGVPRGPPDPYKPFRNQIRRIHFWTFDIFPFSDNFWSVLAHFMALLGPGTYPDRSGAKFCSGMVVSDLRLVQSGPFCHICHVAL